AGDPRPGFRTRARDRGGARPTALPGGEGIGRHRRGEPDRKRAAGGWLRGVADSRDPAPDQPGCARRGSAREHRGGHPRQPPRAAAGGESVSERSDAGERTRIGFATIEEAIDDLRQGHMVVVVDDENRENEGDLTLAAQFATPEAINFMAKEG